MDKPFSIVVLISGNGSNLQAIINETQENKLPVSIKKVISSQPDAYGLMRAQNVNIPTETIQRTDFQDNDTWCQGIMTLIDAEQPDLIVLAGFMHILSSEFVNAYTGKLINIHPSLLPKFRGLNTHQRALQANETTHGASVHYVSEQLDAGTVIMQTSIPIQPGDTAEVLASRVLKVEHRLYPEVINRIANQRVCLEGNHVLMDGKVLKQPEQLDDPC